MEKTNKLDPKQREKLADMLTSAKLDERSRLENADGVSSRSILRTLAKEVGALKLVEQVEELNNKTKDAEEALADHGFEISGSGNLQLKWDAPDGLSEKYDKRMEEAKPSIQKSLKKYDLAILGVWTAETGDDAKAIMEGLL